MSHSNQTTTNHNPDAEDKDQNNNVFTDSPTVLSFSSMDWRDVPMDCVWGVMEHITILELDDNRLTKLPPFLLEALPCLERLDVARNRLTQLPSNIGYWKQLKMISVPGNRIGFLPKSMGQMPKLEYFNMELNPMNPALQEVVETIPRWNVSGCQDFARQIYTLTVQLPNVSAELRRNRAYDHLHGGKKPPLPPTKVESRPRFRRAIPQLIRKGRKPLERKNTKVKPLVVVPSLKLVPAGNIPPVAAVVPVPSVQEPGDTPSSASTTETVQPQEPVVDDRQEYALVRLGSRIIVSTKSSQLDSTNMNVQLGSQTSIASSIKESITQLSITQLSIPTIQPAPQGRSVWFRMFLALYMFVTELLRYGTYGSCIFGCIVGLCGLFVDQGILTAFLARPWVSYILPQWFQSAFLYNHSLAIAQLSTFCIYFPLYRTAPGGFLVTLITFGTWIYAKLSDLLYAII